MKPIKALQQNPNKISAEVANANSHVRDQVVSEFGALDLGCAIHLAGEIVGDALAGNRAIESFQNEIGGFNPAEVSQHHLAGENDGAGVDLILAGILGRGAVRGLEDGVAGDVINIAAGRDADAADLRSQRVTQIIAIEIERGDDIKIRRTREHLLEGDVGDGVLDEERAGLECSGLLVIRSGFALFLLGLLPLGPSINLVTEDAFGRAITPVAKSALGVFHDIALVDNRHVAAFVGQRIFHGGFHQANGTDVGDSLDSEADLHGDVRAVVVGRGELHVAGDGVLGAETDFGKVLREFLREEIQNLLRLGRAADKFDAGINVLRVLAEDDHVHLLRMFHGAGYAREPLHWAQADVQIEHLAQRDIERAHPAADGRGERAFDADKKFAERLHCVIGQPVVELLEGRFAGEDLHPRDLALPFISFLDRRIHHAHGSRPDVGACAITTDERDDGNVRDREFAASDGDFSANGNGASSVRHDKNNFRLQDGQN